MGRKAQNNMKLKKNWRMKWLVYMKETLGENRKHAKLLGSYSASRRQQRLSVDPTLSLCSISLLPTHLGWDICPCWHNTCPPVSTFPQRARAFVAAAQIPNLGTQSRFGSLAWWLILVPPFLCILVSLTWSHTLGPEMAPKFINPT